MKSQSISNPPKRKFFFTSLKQNCWWQPPKNASKSFPRYALPFIVNSTTPTPTPPRAMAASLSTAELAALKRVVELGRLDSGTLPGFFKDFLKEWGARIPASKVRPFFRLTSRFSFSRRDARGISALLRASGVKNVKGAVSGRLECMAQNLAGSRVGGFRVYIAAKTWRDERSDLRFKDQGSRFRV